MTDLVLPRYTAINLISGLFQNRPLMKGYQALGAVSGPCAACQNVFQPGPSGRSFL